MCTKERVLDIVEHFIATTDPSTFSSERWAELLRSHAEPIKPETPATHGR